MLPYRLHGIFGSLDTKGRSLAMEVSSLPWLYPSPVSFGLLFVSDIKFCYAALELTTRYGCR